MFSISFSYKIKSVNLHLFSVEDELSISFSHSLGQTCLYYKNGNAENSVLCIQLRYYKGKEDLIFL